MSGGDFFDDNEFGSASANDSPWETIGDPSSNMMAFNNQDVNEQSSSSFINDFSNSVAEDFGNSSNAPTDAATVASSYVPASTASAYTPPTMSMDPSTNDVRQMTTGSSSSRRQSMEELASSNNAALREWETRHEEQLEQKRETEERLKEERRKEAQQQLSGWYKEREARLHKIRQQNRANEAQESQLRQQSSSSDMASNSKESWTRTCELIEFTSDGSSASQAPSSSKLALQVETKTAVTTGKGKGSQSATLNGAVVPPPKQPLQPTTTKDTSRMQQLLLQLKVGNTATSHMSNGIAASH